MSRIRLAASAERLDALEVVRSHREDEVALGDDRARELSRAMRRQIEVALHADEQRAVRRGRAVPRARAGARRPRRRAARARSRPCARSPRPAGCDRCCRCRRRGASCRSRVSDEVGHALAQTSRRRSRPAGSRADARPVQSTTVDGCRRRERAAVEHAKRAARDRRRSTALRISRADIAGGTPGRFALVDVIASPCARISR